MKSTDSLPLPVAILHAAMETFMERGYDQTSMDEVAARARTTKRTVYSHYGNKEALFRAALGQAVELFLGKLQAPSDLREPADELEAFAARFCELCTVRGSVRLQRVAMGLAERFPDIGHMLHRDVIERAEAMMAGYLAALARDRDLVAGAEAEIWGAKAARLFLNLATGSQRFQTLLGAREPLDGPPGPETSPQVDREPIARAVALFLAGIGVEGGQERG
ncbi:TetR/AcrR family transcriptional regulator [Rubellimicrobium roseum]|nr:TetR/AcrR family transcriptional regulator [Rubellimicrobium roseum]